MKTLFATLFLLASISICYAQQINLTGQVSIHNSQYRTGQIEYVEGTAVSAPFAGETSSDSEGKFQLTFTGLEAGSNTSLVVEKAGLEVVNERDILNVILGRKQPLKVFLARKGELTQRQTELYAVSVAALTAKHDALIASLRAGGEESTRTLQELEQQLNRAIEHRYEAEDIIREQLDAAKERLPEMVKRLAEMNLDFASAIYRQAYDAYLRGDIPSALALLDEEALSDKADGIVAALSDIEDGQQDFQLAIEAEQEKASQVYESYALKASAYELVFDYRSAAVVLRKGVELLEAVKEHDDLELADAYGNLGVIYQESGDYPKALEALRKEITIIEKIVGINHLRTAISYSRVASLLEDMGKYEEALKTQGESLTILEKHYESDHPIIAVAYSDLSSKYIYLGNYEKALQAQQKAIAIREKTLEPDHPDFATSYYNLALIYLDQQEYSKALQAQKKSIAIDKSVLKSNHPRLAGAYNNFSLIYLALENYPEALQAQQQAISIQEQVLDPNHPNIATSYHNLATIYRELGEYEKGLQAIQKALTISEQVLEPNHPDIASSYNTLARLYKYLGDFDKAIQAHQQALAIIQPVLEYNHPFFATSYHNMALVFFDQYKLDSALIYEEKAYVIWKEIFPPDHPQLEYVESNLALAYKERGTKRQSNGKYKDALQDFQKALNFDPENPELHNQKGLCYYYTKEYDKAIRSYDKSFQLDARSKAIYLNNTGMAYAKLGDLEEAKKRFKQLQDLIPDNAIIYRNWAFYYVLLDEIDMGLSNLENAILLGYDNWEWLRTEEALEPLREHPRFQALLEQAPDTKE